MTPGRPATPGVRNPTVNPFLSGQNLIERAQQEAAWAGELSDLRQQSAAQQADTQFGLRQLANEQERSSSGVTEGMIARGLFRSTVREGALADVTADFGLRADALRSAAHMADQRLQLRQQQIQSVEKPAFYQAQNVQSVENARDLNAESEYSSEPTPATPATRTHTPGHSRRKRGVNLKRERRILTSWRRRRRPGASQRRANVARRRLAAARRRRRRTSRSTPYNGPNAAPTPTTYSPGGSLAPNAAGR